MENDSMNKEDSPSHDESFSSHLTPLQLLFGIPLTIITLAFTCSLFYFGLSKNHPFKQNPPTHTTSHTTLDDSLKKKGFETQVETLNQFSR